MARAATQDLSSFMCIVLMTIGFLVTILVINVIVITSNPTNVEITSVVKFATSTESDVEGAAVPFFSGKTKEPSYIDIHRDHIVIYPGEILVSVSELEEPGNALERLLKKVERNSDTEYVCMLLRPRSAVLARRLKKIVKSQGIDVGQELFEEKREVDYQPAKLEDAIKKLNQAEADGTTPGETPGEGAPPTPAESVESAPSPTPGPTS